MKRFRKIPLYLNTIKYLKPTQVYYQLWYRLKREIIKYKNPYLSIVKVNESKLSGQKFDFLNIPYKFNKSINWNYLGNGKLWCYNLNYFEFIHDIDADSAKEMLFDYIDKLNGNSIGMEPYCISQRGVNWIKWIINNKIEDSIINKSLYSQYQYLSNFLEFQLMGNHLLESVISLLWAGIYFKKESWIKRAGKLLSQQLKEQILPYGAHFELSPMYHQILLGRLLDTYSFLETRHCESNLGARSNLQLTNAQQLLKTIIPNMLSYLNSITFSNGDIPLVNDSTNGIAPTTTELNIKAKLLFESINFPSREGIKGSVIRTSTYELFIDVAQIGPDYIPGHAHADTFNFILYLSSKLLKNPSLRANAKQSATNKKTSNIENEFSPLIVDSSISTYEDNEFRHHERSTKAHNTVVVNGEDSSQVWSSFRVANRAKVNDVQTEDGRISAKHDGYKSLGCIHERIFEYGKEIVITDILKSKNDVTGVAYFHFNDDVKVEKIKNTVLANGVKLEFKGQISIELQNYKLAKGFNVLVDSTKIAVKFNRKLVTKILI